MDAVNEAVRSKALLRLSKVLKIPMNSLDGKMKLDTIEPEFVSFFKRNELDLILDDVYDVAPSKIYKLLTKGGLVIETVDDYADHMVNCYSENSRMVISVLGDIEPTE